MPAASNGIRLCFGLPDDLNALIQRFASRGATVTESKDDEGRKTLTVKRPPVESRASGATSLWMRLRRRMGF
jgi:hypothetical protein